MANAKKLRFAGCGRPEIVLLRKGRTVLVSRIRRTANLVSISTSRLIVLDGGRGLNCTPALSGAH